ncbi:MAG: hypothetical protein Q9227_000160 [Pyrenula ochraceoflavens]
MLMEGIRKSHVAYEYASQFRKRAMEADSIQPQHIFWLNAGDESKLRASCQEICRTFDLKPYDAPLVAMKEWLQNKMNARWLLILDGFDDIDNVTRWLPDLPCSGKGQTLITTRNREVLQHFTHLDDDTTLAIPRLRDSDALNLFRSIVGFDFEIPDEEFKTLILHTQVPLFVKHAALYLQRNQPGHFSVGVLNKAIESNISFIQQLRIPAPVTSRDGIHDNLFRALSIFLCPLIQSYKPDQDEFLLLGIFSCFAADNLDVNLLSKLYQKRSYLFHELLGLYSNHSLIQEDIPGRYRMHDLIPKSMLCFITISDREDLGPRYALECFRWMLQGIFIAYQADEKTRAAPESTQVQRNLTSWKRQYMPHFEEFLRYVKLLEGKEDAKSKLKDWNFSIGSVRSVLTFSRVFSCDNRVDDAILLLKFVLAQGINRTSDEKTANELHADTSLELADFLAERRSGRRENTFLTQAKGYLGEALQIAESCSLPARIWRARVGLVKVLTKLQLFPDAHHQVDRLNKDFIREENILRPKKERVKLRFRLAREYALLKFREGQFSKKKELVVESRTMYQELLHELRTEMSGEEEMLEDVSQRLARVDAVIPLQVPLDEAENIFIKTVQKLRKVFSDSPKHRPHPRVAIAELNLVALRLRMNKIDEMQDSVDCLNGFLEQAPDENDGLTRNVAYTLRDYLRKRGNSKAVEDLQARFQKVKLLPILEEEIWFDATSDPDPESQWPVEWGESLVHVSDDNAAEGLEVTRKRKLADLD